MEQVKIFNGYIEGNGLEKRINDWLSEMGDKIEIISKTHSATQANIQIMFFYKTKKSQPT